MSVTQGLHQLLLQAAVDQQQWHRAVELLLPLSRENHPRAAPLAAAVLPHCASLGIGAGAVRTVCAFAMAHCPAEQVRLLRQDHR